MNHRPEIDGLRAIAVLPVILFHAGFGFFSGGFVGVDVFFVISGYLITTILIEDLERGEFSLLRFYERRARRILPALFFVMLCCIPFAWMWMLPQQLVQFGQSVIAVSVFASNFLFWQESGYFAPAAEMKPLIHTWSLAVEEQYYVLFPAFLLFAWRFGRRPVLLVIVVIAVTSLALSEWGWRNAPAANFYLAPTRAWELLAGSLAAFIVHKRGVQKNNLLALVGLAAILCSIFAFDEGTPFPSLFTLAPVLGVVFLILFAEPTTLAARLLGTRALVGIGLISYSAYLWHQPLFAFARLRSLHEPSQLFMGALACASLLLAVFSWQFIEQPFRKADTPIINQRRVLFRLTSVCMVAFVVIGVLGNALGQSNWHPNPQVNLVLSAAGNQASSRCHYSSMSPYALPEDECSHRIPNPRGRILIAGDSHAMSVSSSLIASLNAARFDVYNASHSACVPLPGFRTFGLGPGNLCAEFVDALYAFSEVHSIETVVLTARFPLYYWGNRFDNGEGGVEDGGPGYIDDLSISFSEWDSAQRRRRALSLLEQRITELSQHFNLVLVAPVPEAGWNVPLFAAQRHILGLSGVDEISTSLDAYLNRSLPILSLFERLSNTNENIAVARIDQTICDSEVRRCALMLNGDPLYADSNHLNIIGAELVSPQIAATVELFYTD